MAKGNILKEAIADAKAVREVALENAKAALEEAFTPKLQNMLSAKLQEDLDEDTYMDEDEDNIELGEMGNMYDEDMEEDMYEGEEEDSMDEEIDLEEILNELELEEGKKADDEEVVAEGDDEEEEIDEAHRPIFKADETQLVNPKPEYVHGINEDEEFDLDSLLKEINNLDENQGMGIHSPRPATGRFKNRMAANSPKSGRTHQSGKPIAKKRHVAPAKAMFRENDSCKESKEEVDNLKKELNEIKKSTQC